MIIADTGFWVAMFDDGDAFHAAAIKVAGHIQEPLISTLPVVTEVCYLLQSPVGCASRTLTQSEP
jgi:predicted nucleic acid-binding protein